MRWRLMPLYLLMILLGIVGALTAAVLLALLVAIGMGADERGATVALWLVLLAWAGFALVFLWGFWRRDLKRFLERILLTLALAAFALPLAGLGFAMLLWVRTFEPVGEITAIVGQALGLILGGLGVVLAMGLVALAFGGLTFLIFVLLKFNLAHVGRALDREAQRRMNAGTVRGLILVGALAGLVAMGAGYGQASLERTLSPERVPGVYRASFPCPMMNFFIHANILADHTERAILGALLRLNGFTDRLLTVLGRAPREAPALRAARRLLESYVFSTGNPNLQVGTLRDLGEEVEGEIVTHSQEPVERVRVHTRTGALRAVR